ncbi:hypothetical protein Rhopal_005190-T1 [Rhodotorula paludigena]|uniref:Golgi apparatus membrane protein tvp38 n=1 Tax=Rhodotorula paludigena TaxID=86838 RepID=A0AAV5GRN3_9BASI|nr:hypothetical protein Rhopal_005190-T1 [Rhodotorula paludigena]
MPPVQEARVIAPEEAADIVRTVSKLRVLRPLFTYAIHHPLRFLGSYVLLPLLHLLLSLLSLLASLVLALLSTLLSPATFLFSTFVLGPISAASSFASATAPIWYALLAALAAGTLGGALAGIVAARPARSAIDGTLARGTRGLRWLGVLPKEQDAARGGYGPGATLERTSEKARGKRRATLGEGESISAYEEVRDSDEETDGDV